MAETVIFESWRLVWMLILLEWLTLALIASYFFAIAVQSHYRQSHNWRSPDFFMAGHVVANFGVFIVLSVRVLIHYQNGRGAISDARAWESMLKPIVYGGGFMIIVGYLIVLTGALNRYTWRFMLGGWVALHAAAILAWAAVGGFGFEYR